MRMHRSRWTVIRVRGCHQTAGMSLYTPMCTHTRVLGHGPGGSGFEQSSPTPTKLEAGLKKPKAQEIAVGRKNTPVPAEHLPQASFTASSFPGRSPNLCSVRNLLRTPAQGY